ncbi:MAG: hypothetical protein AB1815_02615 [Bacillota bacterium]
MLMVEQQNILWAIEPKNYTGAASADKYVSLKNYGRMTIAIQTGAWAGGAAAVTLKQATTVAGAGAKALEFTNYWHDKAVSGTLAETACVNTFNLDAANKLFVIEVDARDLDINGGFDCVSVSAASPGANNDFYGAVYILSAPRYAGKPMPAALTD